MQLSPQPVYIYFCKRVPCLIPDTPSTAFCRVEAGKAIVPEAGRMGQTMAVVCMTAPSRNACLPLLHCAGLAAEDLVSAQCCEQHSCSSAAPVWSCKVQDEGRARTHVCMYVCTYVCMYWKALVQPVLLYGVAAVGTTPEVLADLYGESVCFSLVLPTALLASVSASQHLPACSPTKGQARRAATVSGRTHAVFTNDAHAAQLLPIFSQS